MARNIAIRLGIEGQPEVKRALDETGRAGQEAFRGVGVAADQAGAAVDRQTAKYEKLARAAREAEAQARAQSNINALLGVTPGRSGAARDSASVFEQDLSRQDAIAAARQAQIARNSQASIDALLGVRDAQVGAARASAAAFEDTYRREAEALKRTADLRTAAIRNAATGWQSLSAAGNATLANIEASRRVAMMGGASASGAAGGRGLRPDEVTNLTYQGSDLLAQLGSGTPLGMIAMQQGPQIAQVFAGPGGASVKGAFVQASEGASALLARIGLVGGAIGGVTAAVAVGSAAWASYRSEQRSVEKQLEGLGAASRVTASDLNRVAEARSGAAGISTSEARGTLGALAGTGRIGGEIGGRLLGISRDVELRTGMDRAEVNELLARSFADPARGAEELDKRFNILDATSRRSIQTMDAQGNRLGAQRALMDALGTSVDGARAKVGFFSRQWSEFTTNTSNEFDRIGGLVDRATGGGDTQTRLNQARGFLESARSRQGTLLGSVSDMLLGGDVEIAERRVRELEAQLERERSRGVTARNRDISKEIDDLVRGYNRGNEQLRLMESGAQKIATLFREMGREPFGEAKILLDAMGTQVAQMRIDMAAGGSAFADSLRRARFEQSTVGYAPEAKREADIRQDIENRKTDVMRNITVDVMSPEGLIRAQQSLKSLDEELATRINALKQQTIIEGASGSRSGYAISLAQAPAQYRDIIYQNAMRTGLNPDLIASQLKQESGFNPNAVSPAGAQGIAQFMPATAKAYGLKNPFDPADSIRAQTDYMRDMMRQYNNDEVSALVAYNASTKVRERFQASGRDLSVLPGETRNYVGSIKTSPPNLEQQIKEREREIQATRQQVSAAQGLIAARGRETDATRAEDEAQRRIAEERSRGINVTETYISQIRAESLAKTQAASATRFAGFLAQSDFDRDQLGRSEFDQRVYGQARPFLGTGFEDKALEIARENTSLAETRSLITDSATSFASDLRRSGDAAEALSNVLGSVADRLTAKAIDSVVSGGFDALIKGGGASSLGDMIKSIMPGSYSGGGYTGSGGKYDPAGVVHRGEYVFDAASTSRLGVGTLEAIRRGLPGYASGGPVGFRPPVMPSAPAPQVVFAPNIIPPPGYRAEMREVTDDRGGRRPEITFAEVTAAGINSRQGRAALAQTRRRPSF